MDLGPWLAGVGRGCWTRVPDLAVLVICCAQRHRPWSRARVVVFLNQVSGLDSALLLSSAPCVFLGDTSSAQLGLSVFIHKMGTVPSLLQGSQDCGEGCEGPGQGVGAGMSRTAGLGPDCWVARFSHMPPASISPKGRGGKEQEQSAALWLWELGSRWPHHRSGCGSAARGVKSGAQVGTF